MKGIPLFRDWKICFYVQNYGIMGIMGLLAKPGQPVLTFDKGQTCNASYQVVEWTLIELRFNIIKILSCLFLFELSGFIMCNF